MSPCASRGRWRAKLRAPPLASLQWLLDLVLVVLLAVTLVHALRLERALRALKRDRGSLDEVLAAFATSTHEAEAGIEKFRNMTEGARAQIARQAELGGALKDDLAFLIERGDRLADRMDGLVRTARPIVAEAARPALEALPALHAQSASGTDARPRSQAERDLLAALRATR